MLRGRPFGRVRSGVASWHPRQLFVGGVAGALYLPRPETCRVMSDGSGSPAVVGDPIGWLADESGGNRHATQATTAAKPILRQEASGRWYLEFDGIDDGLQTATGGGYAAATVSAAVRATGGAGTFRTVYSDRNGNTGMQLLLSSNNALGFYIGDGVNFGTGALSANDSVVVGTNYLLSGAYADAQARVWLNGVAQSPVTRTLAAAPADGFKIGVRDDSSVSFLAMRLYGLAAVNALLATSDLYRLERYLARLGGVAL